MLKEKLMLRKYSIVSVLIYLIAIVFLSATSMAQTERTRVQGTVTDPSGERVAGARVLLRDAAGLVVYQTYSDSEGRFVFPEVEKGRYRLTVEAAGFAQAGKPMIDLSDIEKTPAQPIVVNVRLDVAAISDQIVVTATRTESATVQLGGSITVITGDEIERAHQSLVSESLRVIPGLTVAQTGGRGGLTSIFSRGGESDYNKVLIDGVPVNAAGGLFDFGSLTTENLERIEVARGPQSALFGSDAMTSVIQLLTRRGSTPTPEFEMTGEGGSFDFHRETARLSGLAGPFDYSASFGFQSTDGRFQNSNYINRSASLSLGYRFSDNADARVTARSNNNTLGVPGPTAALFADPDQRQRHHDVALSSAFNFRAPERWHQSARLIYSEFDTHNFDRAAQDLTRPDRPPLGAGAFGPDFAFSFRNHQKRAGFQYQSVAAIFSSNVVTAGVDFERESAVFTDDFSRVSPARNNLGVYIQDQFAWRERLFATAGIRVERNSGRVPDDLRAALLSLGSIAPAGEAGFGTTANPKLAVSFLAHGHRERTTFGATRLKASFGTGIKEPQLDEAFSPNIFFLGNPALNPERSISFEVGAVQEFASRRASVEITYFDNRFRDLIVFVSDPITFGPIKLADGRLTNFINQDRASARGLEMVAATRPVRQLRASASYTFLRSRLERADGSSALEVGLPLLRRPTHSGSIELSWVAERFDISVDGTFLGRRRDFDPVTFARFDATSKPIFNDGYARLNASGSYHFNNRITAFARVENFLNRDYQEILGFPAYRLNFSAGLRLRLGGGK